MVFCAALIIALLTASLPLGITAAADGAFFVNLYKPKINYKIEITSESKASGWNSASLKLGCRSDGGKADKLTWDIKSDMEKGETFSKTFEMGDDVPFRLRMYLDFGGGFTVRSHKGRIKFYADGEEIMNEEYKAQSYPFNSSDETIDFGIYGVSPTIVIGANGSQDVYTTVKKAWNAAMKQDGCTVMLWEGNSTVAGTLEATRNVTLDFNGYLLANSEPGPLFRVKPGGNLKLIDSDPDCDTGETFICNLGATGDEDADKRSYRLKGGGIYHGGSQESGGAVKIEKGGSLTVSGCTVTDCHSGEGNGGAIFCEGSLKLNGTKFISCTALEGFGGAIAFEGAPEASLENLTFERCAADNGGAIGTGNIKGDPVISAFSNCKFNYCHSSVYGGAVYFAQGMSVTADKLTFNNCAAEWGGAVYHTAEKPFTLNDSKIEGCSAKYGGGLAYNEAGEMTLNNVEISKCSGNENGGGLYLMPVFASGAKESSNLNISNCDIHDCTAKKNGGGVCVEDDGDTDDTNKVLFRGTKIRGNQAETGGGMYAESYFVYLIDSSVTGNRATGKHGGGIYVDSMRDIEVAGEISIRDNTAKGEVNNLCLQNGTFSSAKIYSGGLYDGSYIGISSTANSKSTIGINFSQVQALKFLHADEVGRTLAMDNTREVATPLFASMISQRASLAIIIGGVALIAGITAVLIVRKKRKEGKENDETDRNDLDK